ncbi:MAG TPA: threonine/serine exporter family protein [Candidatus Cloacimonadota bacterium]|nr:threonine/serine exporter family protein [Candidatus Cloacimonadota bacterium]HOV17051.1 threonine/serine exporter family protein [Candidatus Cloacimonadota bacterium]HQL15324.1 threonine/serine exporter family protein [Candidatus Cloacimonadota bacterium]
MLEAINRLWWMQVGYGFIAILGFSIRSNIKGWKLIFTGLGGALSWGLYLLFLAWSKSLLLSIFLATSAVCLYAEFMGRAYKMPVSVFVICAIIPLVPGSGLYYSMKAYIDGKMLEALKLMGQTLMIAGTISVAIAVMSSITNLFRQMLRRF